MTATFLHRAHHLAWLLLCTAALVACQPAVPSVTPKEKAFMTSYTTHLVPRCFGRYLIDLPADMVPVQASGATFAITPYTEYSGAIRVTVAPEPKSVFEHQLAQRQQKLEGMRIDLHPDWPYLAKIVPLADGSGVMFNRSENGGSRGARTLELHGWKDGYAIEMGVNAGDDQYPEYAKLSPNLHFGNDVPVKLRQLQSLYTRISGRAPNEVPSGHGACFKNGFVSGLASDAMREDIAMGFVSKSMPDIEVHLSTDSGIQNSDTLLDRVPALKKNFEGGYGQIIRQGTRTSQAGVKFEDVLAQMTKPNGTPLGQFFIMEANGKKGGPRTPLLNIKLTTGNWEDAQLPKYPKSSLSEGESVALWDDITATLRERPGAF